MKIAIVIAAVLGLSGCVVHQGPVVGAHEVGQVRYLGGSGLVYKRATSQVSTQSQQEGEAYLAEIQSRPNPMAEAQRRAAKRQADAKAGERRKQELDVLGIQAAEELKYINRVTR